MARFVACVSCVLVGTADACISSDIEPPFFYFFHIPTSVLNPLLFLGPRLCLLSWTLTSGKCPSC